MSFALSRFGKTLSFAVLAAAASLSTLAQAADDSFARVMQSKKLTVGYIPYDDLTKRDLASGKIVGFFPDVIQAIANDAGIATENITYVATDWANFAVGLQAQKYDISISGTFKTIPRATAAAFTQPLFYLGNSAIALKDDARFANITDVMQLDQAGLTIAVVSGEQSHDFVKQRFKNATIKVVKSADLSTGLMEVTSKRADIALSDHYVVKAFAAKNPNVVDVFADKPWNLQPIAWAVKADDQRMLNFLNASLEYLQSTGRLAEIMAKPEYATVPFMVSETSLKPAN